MDKYTAKCTDCKALFEVTIKNPKEITCPSCNSKKNKVLKKEEAEVSGCGGCSGCTGCH